jgi:hypothetical protein
MNLISAQRPFSLHLCGIGVDWPALPASAHRIRELETINVVASFDPSFYALFDILRRDKRR